MRSTSINHYFTRRILFLLLLLTSSNIQATPLILDSKAREAADISLSSYLELLEDPTRKLDIKQVSSVEYNPHFKANTVETPSFGRTQSAWWARFQLHSTTALERYLLLDQPITGSVNIFVLPKATKARLHPLKNSHLSAYKLELPINETITIYLRVTNGQASLALPLKLLTSERLIAKNNIEIIIFSVLFGGMLILALYNFLMYLSLKESANLTLVVFIISIGIVFQRDSGLFFGHHWPFGSEDYFYSTPFLLAIASGFHYWHYVNQGESRVLEQLCKATTLFSLSFIPFIGLLPQSDIWILGILGTNITIIFIQINRMAYHGHPRTRKSYWAGVTLIASLSPYIYVQLVWINDYVLFIYIAQSGVLLAALLLSFAQAEQSRLVSEEKERLEASSKAKDDFLTTMSHELRTPIHAITGITDLLQQQKRSKEETIYLDKLQSSSQHLQILVNDILDLSKIEATQLKLEITPFQLDKELKSLQKIFSVMAQQKGLKLSIRQDKTQSLYLQGDPTRLKQILINLLSNAIKFTHQGHVHLSIGQEACEADGIIRLNFEVKDTGIGISTHQQKMLFHPFSQADSSTTRRYGGSGLGLVISHKLVKLMGGQLELESEPKKGSRFFFALDLPLVQEEPKKLESNEQNKLCGLMNKGFHILLIDDDETNLYLGKQMLERLGIKATLAESGQTALQYLQQYTFDLVMMDISMPDMDGYMTTQKIRQSGYNDLPIIAVTAHAIKGEQERCQNAGMNDYLSKPFRLKDLYKVLCESLDS